MCQSEAGSLQKIYSDLKDRGFIILTLMGEDLDGSPATVATAKAWADEFNIEYPVLVDPEWGVGYRYGFDGQLPTYTILTAGNVVALVGIHEVDESLFESLLPQ